MHNRWYGASCFQAVVAWGRNAGNFKGRSSRSEYWWVWLFGYLLSVIVNLIVLVQGRAIFSNNQLRQTLIIALLVVIALTVVPSASLQVRRLRDAGIALPKGVTAMGIDAVTAVAVIFIHGLIGKLALVGMLASGAILLWWSYQPSIPA
ncbi:DUF805 domain-containing protein [Lacticaseibacillus porcinae]|uniref:DUF805 domain-containing protein n=1 Tax=Lacticaseibacillus porcinae TaxID=1123687 RepID=UPI000F776B19|nr:DUF805 domain-containing protein [Lacticaseibacillus porcinae]